MADILGNTVILIHLIRALENQAHIAEGNQERCKLLSRRCSALIPPLELLASTKHVKSGVSKTNINNKANITPTVTSASAKVILKQIENLKQIISKCSQFIEHYGGPGWKLTFNRFFNAHVIEEEFKSLNEQLSQAAIDLNLGISIKTSQYIQENETALKSDCACMVDFLRQVEEIHNLERSDFKQHQIQQDNNIQLLIKLLIQNINSKNPEVIKHSSNLFGLAEENQYLDSIDSSKKNIFPSPPTTPSIKQIVLTSSEQTSSSEAISAPILPPISEVQNLSLASAAAVSTKSNTSDILLKETAIIHQQSLQWDEYDDSRIIGQGNYGTVYSAVYQNKPVALKQFKNFHFLTPKELSSIKREALIMQSCRHLNIIEFIGLDLVRGILLSELAYCSLYTVMYDRKKKPLLHIDNSSHITSAVKILWCYQILCGLRFLHFHGIIHRDLKLANVLLVYEPSMKSYIAKITDFGVSTAVGLTSTRGTYHNINNNANSNNNNSPKINKDGQNNNNNLNENNFNNSGLNLRDIGNNNNNNNNNSNNAINNNNHNNNNMNNNGGAVGTAAYMAPELFDDDLAANEMYTVSVDMYAFGITANELFTGHVPWKGLKEVQIIKKVFISCKRPPIFTPVPISSNNTSPTRSSSPPLDVSSSLSTSSAASSTTTTTTSTGHKGNKTIHTTINPAHVTAVTPSTVTTSATAVLLKEEQLIVDIIGDANHNCLHQDRMQRPTAESLCKRLCNELPLIQTYCQQAVILCKQLKEAREQQQQHRDTDGDVVHNDVKQDQNHSQNRTQNNGHSRRNSLNIKQQQTLAAMIKSIQQMEAKNDMAGLAALFHSHSLTSSSSFSSVIAENLCIAIGNACLSDNKDMISRQNRVQFGLAQGCVGLANLIQQPLQLSSSSPISSLLTLAVAEQACWAIEHACYDYEENIIQFSDAGGCAGLAILMLALEPLTVSIAQVVIENVCLALRTVLISSSSNSIKHDINITQFSDAGGCEALVKVLSKYYRESETIAQVGSSIIYNLIIINTTTNTKDTDIKVTFLKADAVIVLKSILEKYTTSINAAIHKVALDAMNELQKSNNISVNVVKDNITNISAHTSNNSNNNGNNHNSKSSSGTNSTERTDTATTSSSPSFLSSQHSSSKTATVKSSATHSHNHSHTHSGSHNHHSHTTTAQHRKSAEYDKAVGKGCNVC